MVAEIIGKLAPDSGKMELRRNCGRRFSCSDRGNRHFCDHIKASLFRRFRRFYLYRLRGYTLLELLSVVAIVGTLTGISVPLYSNYIHKARMTKVIAEIRTLEKEILTFQSTADRFPNSLLEIGVNNVLDPWKNPYQYCDHGSTPQGKWRKYKATVPITDDFDLYSMGQDGNTAVAITSKAGSDDIIRADNGRYVGPALDF